MNGTDPSPQDISHRRQPDHRPQGEGLPLQPAGHRQPHGQPSWPTPTRPAYPWWASMRRCRSPATTTSPGCWPRSTPCSAAVANGTSTVTAVKPVTSARDLLDQRAEPGCRARRPVGRGPVGLVGRAARSSARSPSRVGAGEVTGLIGINGAGKTTLLRAVLGLQPMSSGRVHLAGGRRSVGYVPQKVLLDPDLPVRARDLVELGIDGRRLGIPLRSAAKRARVEELLASVDGSALRRRPGRGAVGR